MNKFQDSFKQFLDFRAKNLNSGIFKKTLDPGQKRDYYLNMAKQRIPEELKTQVFAYLISIPGAVAESANIVDQANMRIFYRRGGGRLESQLFPYSLPNTNTNNTNKIPVTNEKSAEIKDVPIRVISNIKSNNLNSNSGVLEIN